MAITGGPFHGQDTTEDEFSRFAREFARDGVVGSIGDTTLKVTADSSGMTVSVAAGLIIGRGYWLRNTAAYAVTIAAAHATLDRIDRIVARFDPTTDAVALVRLAGDTGAPTTPPALTQTDTGIYELPLATVAVAHGVVTIAAGNVADERLFHPNPVRPWTTATRPAAPRKGQVGFNDTTGKVEFYNGATWVTIASGSLDAATIEGRHILEGDSSPTAGDGADGDLWLEY